MFWRNLLWCWLPYLFYGPLVAILTIWRVYLLIKSIKTTGTIQKYLVQIQSEKQVTKSLLGSANGDIKRMVFGEVVTLKMLKIFEGSILATL